MSNLAIGGEVIAVADAIKLVDGLYNHAYELAGQFYEKNRSAKFRINWPNAYDFAEVNRKAFVEQARADYSAELANPKTEPKRARHIYLALLIERAFATGLEALGKESDTQLQVRKGTETFEGDKAENRKLVETYGLAPNLRAALKTSAAKLATMH